MCLFNVNFGKTFLYFNDSFAVMHKLNKFHFGRCLKVIAFEWILYCVKKFMNFLCFFWIFLSLIIFWNKSEVIYMRFRWILFILKCVPPLMFSLVFDYFQDFKVYFDIFWCFWWSLRFSLTRFTNSRDFIKVSRRVIISYGVLWHSKPVKKCDLLK